MNESPDINEYLTSLKVSRKFGPQVVCFKTLPGKSETYSELSKPLSPQVSAALERQGISDLYSHQVQAIEAIRSRKDVIVATPTASGKSLVYNIPIIENHLAGHDNSALYLFPLKALAQDQLKALTTLYRQVITHKNAERNDFAAIYDGDTTPYMRKQLRLKPPSVLISNPDMLHLSLLSYHDSWSSFFKRLRYVVIDEVHTYRGLFGAHMAWVLRRLQRIARYYHTELQFIMLSATIGNPEKLAAGLTGRCPEILTQSGSPTARKHVVFLNPWDSAAHTTAQLLESSMKRGLRTIVYTKSRKMTELITMWTKPRVGDLAEKLSSYRAGFLPEDRRKIERDLAEGNLLGVISTSALELGIDIGDLDLCILVGYPGSVMATWQRGGRVGRGMRESAVILIAGEDALDQHFMRNPEDFFVRDAENAALNPDNSRISQLHLHCAAAEIPLDRNEPLVAGSKAVQNEIETLTKSAVLYEDHSGGIWYSSRKRPQRMVDLRGGGLQLAVIQEESGEIIGEIDAHRGLKEAHPGAIYLHHSRTLLVSSLDIDAREVVVSNVKPTYYTRAMVHKHTEILERYSSKTVFGCQVSWGRLKVTEKITGYQKVNNYTQKTISTVPLELPEQVIETEGLWLDLEEGCRKKLEDQKMHFMGAIHAIEHAMIAMFPLLILCDRNDIGGISCPYHEQTGKASIFIYDGYAGGAGLAGEAYQIMADLVEQTENTIRSCGCETGCPSCVHSPKCGSGNRPIDKTASLALLHEIIDSNGGTGQPTSKTAAEHIGKSQEKRDKPELSKESGHVLHYPKGIAAVPSHYCVFDLETKYSAQEVGGWSRADKMGMSVGVVFDSSLDGFVTYLEEEVELLIDHLFQAELVVGFNSRRFDYRVLSGYTERNLQTIPTLDILEEIQARLGYRLSLNRLAEHTLGSRKSSDGLQALKWYKEGKIREIAEYCRKDVALTRDLLLYALENEGLLFKNKAGATVRLPLSLDRTIWDVLNSPSAIQGQSSGL